MESILDLINSGKIDDAYKSFVPKKDVEKYAKEYNNDRKIRPSQVGNREDKITKNDVVATTKIPIPFQRKIVKSAASFLFGSKLNLVPSESNDSFQTFTNLWNDTRMDSLLLKFCKTVKSETEATIVFFPVDVEGGETKIKARLLSNKNGKVHPVFDEFGDMIAFGWEYESTIGDKKAQHLYLWTAEKNFIYDKSGNEWNLREDGETDNQFKKIPVVYMSQEQPEWWEVQDLIDRFENSYSKFADTNDYFSSPMYKAKGGVKSMPKKDETGKMVKLDIIETDKGNIIEADLEVISWDRAPEALKLEFETNKGLIYSLTDTPDLSFDQVKGLGNISGIALKLLFFGSILKAKWDEGDYHTAVSRIINIMKAGISNILNGKEEELKSTDIEINFTSVLPENIKEIIEILTEATGGKPVMSQKTAVAHNPLVADNDDEVETILEESKADNIVGLGETQL